MRDTPVIEAEDEGVQALVARLIDETRQLASAEVALVKAKLAIRLTAYKAAAVFFAVAGVLALAALIALLVGLIMTIATKVGPGWATLIVVGSVFVIVGILAIIGKSRLAIPEAVA